MITFLLGSLAFGEPSSSDPVLDAMVTELNRSFEVLQKQETPPYWIQLAITEHQYEGLTFSDGALFDTMKKTTRVADVDVRVGDWTLDNTHPLIDGGYFSDEPTHFSESVPIGNDPLMLRRYIWKIVDQAYRTSVRRLIKIESNRSLKVELEDQATTGLCKGSINLSLYPIFKAFRTKNGESFTHLFCTNARSPQHLKFFREAHHGTGNPLDNDHR